LIDVQPLRRGETLGKKKKKKEQKKKAQAQVNAQAHCRGLKVWKGGQHPPLYSLFPSVKE